MYSQNVKPLSFKKVTLYELLNCGTVYLRQPVALHWSLVSDLLFTIITSLRWILHLTVIISQPGNLSVQNVSLHVNKNLLI
jgi:hypothetical protein